MKTKRFMLISCMIALMIFMAIPITAKAASASKGVYTMVDYIKYDAQKSGYPKMNSLVSKKIVLTCGEAEYECTPGRLFYLQQTPLGDPFYKGEPIRIKYAEIPEGYWFIKPDVEWSHAMMQGVLKLSAYIVLAPENELVPLPQDFRVQAGNLGSNQWQYTGNPITPKITKLTLGYKGYDLVEGKDYEITYENNVNVGTGAIKIKGLGSYGGEVTRSFKIKDQSPLPTPMPPAGPTPIPSEPSIQLNENAVTLYAKTEDEYSQFTLIPILSGTEGTIYFKSSNKQVAKVGKKTGVIKAVDKGTATITAYLKSDDKVKSSCKVTVKKLKYTIKPLELTVKVGQTKTVTVKPNLKTYKYVRIRPGSKSKLIQMEQKGNKIYITGVKPGTATYFVEGGINKNSAAISYKAKVTVAE